MRPGTPNLITVSEELAGTDLLLDSLKFGIFRYSPAMNLLYFNPAAVSILGISGTELRNQSFHFSDLDIISEDGKPYRKEALPSFFVARTGQSATQVTIGVIKPLTSERIWLQVNAEPLFNEDGSIREIVTSFSDITLQKTAKDQLNSLYQHLEIRAFELSAVNADLEKFIYAATHDLQEPLRLISSFLELLKNKYDHQLDQQANSYIRFAVEGANRMKKLILDLLEYSSISGSGKMMLPTDINAVLDVSRKALSMQLENCKARLIVRTLPVAIVCPPLIAQLFEYMIENALKYKSEADPLIEIVCKEEEENWLFSIRDNGIGIAEINTDRIFDLFHRLHHDSINDGTGAGLAICQKIVSIHRGKIWVNSVPGKGSTFFFTIPKYRITDEKV